MKQKSRNNKKNYQAKIKLKKKSNNTRAYGEAEAIESKIKETEQNISDLINILVKARGVGPEKIN